MSTVCSACGYEQRPGARFCVGCGNAVPPVCPRCGHCVESGDRFCAACGASVAEPVLAEPALAHSAQLPASGWIEGERKQVTVLFADVQGSMELQEELDVEVWAGIVDRFVNILAAAVRRFGGTVD